MTMTIGTVITCLFFPLPFLVFSHWWRESYSDARTPRKGSAAGRASGVAGETTVLGGYNYMANAVIGTSVREKGMFLFFSFFFCGGKGLVDFAC